MTRTDGPFRRAETRDPGQRQRLPSETLHLLSAVVVWLVTGTTISSLNKWIFAVYNFRYPLLLSALHMLTAIVVDYALIKYYFVRHRAICKQDLTSSAKCKVFLLSLTFCASIAFGNLGLTYVQLSFAQMIYTTTPIFTLAISSLVLGKQHHVLKYTAMMPICIGASFSIMGEVQFDQTGCLFVIAATMLRGLKSIQQSILLQEEKINSVLLLYLMAIPSFCILAVAALVLENWTGFQSPLHYDGHLWGFIILSCLGSVLYNLASCCVISLTSAVTLHILGNLSVVGNLLLSQLLFGSQFSALSCAGAALTLSGMIIYQNSELIISYMDARRTRNGKKPELESSPELEPFLELSQKPSLEFSENFQPWSELYDELEPFSKHYHHKVKLFPKPPSELHSNLEPRSAQSHNMDPSPGLYPVLEPLSTQNHKMEPFSELYGYTESASESSRELYHDLDLPLALDHDLEPSPGQDHDLETSPGQDHDLETCLGLDGELELSSEMSDVLAPLSESSKELYLDPEPSSGLDHDPEPSSEVSDFLDSPAESSKDLYHDPEPSSETPPAVDSEPSTEPYDELDAPSEWLLKLDGRTDKENHEKMD